MRVATVCSLLLLAALMSEVNACGNQPIPNLTGNGYIVGGQAARQGSWPWQVQIRVYNSHYCGATLIDRRWVLTAAHCVEDAPNSPSRYTLVLGSHYKDSVDSTQISVRPDRVLMHPYYNSRTLDYDYALFRLPQSVNYNNYIQPACLASSTPASGTYCYTTGWGDTKGTGNANVLKQAMVPLIAPSLCSRYYYGITSRMICAGYANGGIDACQGDSGGPLVCKTGNAWTLVGATSWGDGCAQRNKPGVYADIANQLRWIQSTMSANS